MFRKKEQEPVQRGMQCAQRRERQIPKKPGQIRQTIVWVEINNRRRDNNRTKQSLPADEYRIQGSKEQPRAKSRPNEVTRDWYSTTRQENTT